MDITMPNLDGIEATRHILSEFPDTKIIALSIHSGKHFVEGMLRAGAVGYLLKESVPEDMLNAIRAVTHGDVYLSPAISGIVVSQYQELLAKDSQEVQAENTEIILSTKLHRTVIDRNHVYRPRLLERLARNRHRVLTFVSAPAGYGKSTLVSSWMEVSDAPNAWLSLDEENNDLRMFLNYFLAAIQTMFPDAGREAMTMAKALQLPPVSVVAGTIANELNRIEQPFVLVLDDCHLIKDRNVFDLLVELLENPPPNMHLVLISRRDLPLPIHRLRAKGQVTEMRTQELRFNSVESAKFLNNALESQIDPITARALAEKTEGWVTGLRLAASTLKIQGHIEQGLLDPKVNYQYVMEYFFNEVFSQQLPEYKRYLLSTAIFDRFCAPLCDAVCLVNADPSTCGVDGWKFLGWLKKNNIFTIVMDVENQWVRYHHIFHKFLGNQLKRHFSADEIKALHYKAGNWFFDNGFIGEGIKYSMLAGNIERSVQMVVKHGHNLMNSQQWSRLERWLGMLPRDTVEHTPELLIFEAWHNHMKKKGHDLPAMAIYVEKIKRLVDNLTEEDPLRAAPVKGHFDVLRGFQSLIFADIENSKKYTRSACENIPMQHKRARVFARIFQAGAYQIAGDLKTGLSVYMKEMQKTIREDSTCYATYLVNLCFIYWLEADLVTMKKNADLSLKIVAGRQEPETTAFGLYFSGVASYLQNDMKTAEKQLSIFTNDYYSVDTVMSAHASVVLALVYMAGGESVRARKIYEEVLQYAIDANNQEAYIIARALEAEYALWQGNLAETTSWTNQYDKKPFLLPFSFFSPQITLAKILMAQKTNGSQQRAEDLLEELSGFLESIHNKSSLLFVWALQALQLDSRGEKSKALEKLTKAVYLAEPGGFIRPFMDMGIPMVKLLKQLIRENVAVNFIGRILKDAGGAMPSGSNKVSAAPNSLVDPLTNREMDILEQLQARMSNKEIAAKLFISPETVKKHLFSIYSKLNVHSRRQAVDKAVLLGIVTPP
nr:response regulator [Desulfobacterales bacterium]